MSIQNWEKTLLRDLVFFQRGFDITKAEQKEGDVPVVSSSGVKSYHSEARVKGPGVVIGRKGTLGSIHFLDCDYWPHDTTLWSKHLHGNDPRYVYYYLHTLRLEHYNVGNANPTLNRNHIHNLEIYKPPLEIQRKIAGILATYDDLIENNRRRIRLLEESPRLLYREWFVRLRFPGYERVKIVDGVPEGWKKSSIDEISDTYGGGTPSTKIPEYWNDGDITWFVPKDLTNNDSLVLLDSEKKITEAGLKKSAAKILPPETILMSSRASIGYFGIHEFEACTNQGFISVVPKNDNARMYVLYNLIHRVDEIIGLAGGTTYREINKSTFRAIKIMMPEEFLLKQFQDFAYMILKQVKNLKKQNQKLTQARDLLLPKLMAGELEV